MRRGIYHALFDLLSLGEYDLYKRTNRTSQLCVGALAERVDLKRERHRVV
jgi:hypothetical protein